MGGASSTPTSEPPTVEFNPYELAEGETCGTISLFDELTTRNPNIRDYNIETSYSPNILPSFYTSRKNDLIRFNKTYRRVCIRYKDYKGNLVKLVGWLVPKTIIYDYAPKRNPFEATVKIFKNDSPVFVKYALQFIYRIKGERSLPTDPTAPLTTSVNKSAWLNNNSTYTPPLVGNSSVTGSRIGGRRKTKRAKKRSKISRKR